MNDGVGVRLKSERIKLGKSQKEFALAVGFAVNTLQNYEKGTRQPDATFFSAAKKIGCDVNYILHGTIDASTLKKEEAMLIELFRQLDERGRGAVFGAAYGYNHPASMSVNISNLSVNAANSVVTIGSGNGQKESS